MILPGRGSAALMGGLHGGEACAASMQHLLTHPGFVEKLPSICRITAAFCRTVATTQLRLCQQTVFSRYQYANQPVSTEVGSIGLPQNSQNTINRLCWPMGYFRIYTILISRIQDISRHTNNRNYRLSLCTSAVGASMLENGRTCETLTLGPNAEQRFSPINSIR